MGIDHARLRELLETGQGLQLGFAADVTVNPSRRGVQIIGSQVLRVGGEQWDINPWRIYLGPWKPKADIDVSSVVSDEIVPGLAPTPNLDAIEFNGPGNLAFLEELLVYARVKFGSGGVKHVAWIDWGKAGQLWQVSASYVEVDAIAVLTPGFDDEIDDSRLPRLQATLGDEPGGGDASAAGTFTYPFQSVDWADPAYTDEQTARPGLNFVIPPFARSVRFFWDNTRADGSDSYAELAFIRFRRANTLIAEEGVYTYNFTAGEIGDPTSNLSVPSLAAYVRVEFQWADDAPTPLLAGVGVQFELDL